MLSDSFDQYLYNYGPDRVLFQEGTPGDSFYLIKDGLVHVTRTDGDGQVLKIGTVGPGEVVGEMALLGDDSDRSATARTRTDVACWKFNREQFDALLQESGEFRDQILKLLSSRLRETNDQLLGERNRENIIYRAAALVLFLFEDKDLYDNGGTSFAMSPSIRSLRSVFDLSSDVLETILAHIKLEDMRELPPDVQDILQDAAEEILETGLERIDFETPISPSGRDLGASIKFKNLQEAIRAAKQLYAHLKETPAKQLESELKNLKQQTRALEDEFESAQSDPTVTKTEVGQLKAYLDGIKKELTQLSLK